ncbi:MAG: DUF92 domain-containing protein [Nitrososphaeria archaeon]|nr:DUF92 domain-containing protein [Nitrososphaeria archaeon]MDW8021310.1 DUF92 domain-containing protein [Nitrososphaerota archaeon]
MNFFDPLAQLRALIILAIISTISLRYHLLDRKGVLASILIGYLIFTLGGVEHFIILLLFFGLSSIATKVRVREIGANFSEKDWIRGWRNVLANGLVPTLIIVSGYISQPQYRSLATIGYLATVGTAFADTLATEVGLFYPKKPRLITNFKEVAKGTPGAVSPYGYVGGLLASLTICVFSYALGLANLSSIPIIISASMIGMTIDSFIGAAIQAKYRCRVCGKITENSHHCNQQSERIMGVKIINTHMVNLISTAIGGGAALILFSLLMS